MFSINTNLQSLVAQNSLKTSTLKLNTSIERLTTGYKINHTKDNAANFSITNNMSTKIGAYQIAEDNCVMGLDLINTANESLDLISNNLIRLRALVEQAANGTYGKQSIKAMNAEAEALINEIYRTKNSAVSNGEKVFGTSPIDESTYGASGLVINEQGFLQDINIRDTSSMTSLANVDENQTLAVGTYSISSAEELAKLSRMQNAGKITAGSEFVLGADIDLSAYSSGKGWTPIGNPVHFTGTFDGNGHKITNLYINTLNGYQGLFSYTENATIKNLGIEGGEILCGDINSGSLIGAAKNSTVINCYTKIDIINEGVSDKEWLGANAGLIGRTFASGTIDYCYTTGNVISTGKQCGGLVGLSENTNISNSFSTGDIKTDLGTTGGLIGQITNGEIVNCFATGNIYCSKNVIGGLIGHVNGGNIINCHSIGNVTSQGNSTAQTTGGMIGALKGSASNCYTTGNVYSDGSFVGGFVGVPGGSSAIISNCAASGNVEAKGSRVGGFIGQTESTITTVENCYATGNVKGNSYIGGFIGNTYRKIEIQNCYSTGNITNSGSYSGALCGYVTSSSIIENSYSTGNIKGKNYSGGLVGYASSAQITNCYSSGNIEGTGNYVGGLVGYSTSTITDCYVLGKSDSVKGAIAGYASGTITNCKYNSLYEETPLKGSGSATLTDCEAYEGCEPFKYNDALITMQVGINGNSNSRINTDLAFDLGNLKDILAIGLQNSRTIDIIDSAINSISAKQTVLGASQNRLESALSEISTHYENLISSRSTLKDADIADVSSEYIKQQILQQASATLLATANQAPAIALQLL